MPEPPPLPAVPDAIPVPALVHATPWPRIVAAFLDAAVDSPHTRRAYARHLGAAFAFFDVATVADLTGAQLAAWRAEVTATGADGKHRLCRILFAMLRDGADFQPERIGVEEGNFRRTVTYKYRLTPKPAGHLPAR